MQITKIQKYNSTPTAFKAYTISPQARQLAKTCPEKMQLANKAERLFGESRHIDFEILDNFIPRLTIKKTNEKLLGNIKATLLELSSCLRLSDAKTNIDIRLPEQYTAESEEALINRGLGNQVAKASYIGELIKISAEDHSGRFLI